MIKQTNKITGKLNASVIHVYPELENVEITPAVEDQTYTPTKYGFEEVKVKGVQAYIDEDIKPEYIKDGVDILGVVGNVIELNGEEKVVVPKTTQQVILPSENKNAITKIIVDAVDNTIDEDIKPENIIDGVEILGVVGNYKGIDSSDATATPEDILAGKTAYVNNEKIKGTIEVKSSGSIYQRADRYVVDSERTTFTIQLHNHTYVKDNVKIETYLPNTYIAKSANLTSDKLIEGNTVLGVQGAIPNNGILEFKPSDEEQVIPSGLTTGGIVKATDITTLNEYKECLNIANDILGGVK